MYAFFDYSRVIVGQFIFLEVIILFLLSILVGVLRYLGKLNVSALLIVEVSIFITISALIIIFSPGIFLSNFLYLRFIATPRCALQQFYNPDYSHQAYFFQTEDMAIDTLIMAGPKVVPQLIQDVNKSRRGLAIIVLGYYQDKRAIGALTKILNNKKETSENRYYALESIANIDIKISQGEVEKHKYFSSNNLFGKLSRDILQNGVNSNVRTEKGYYFDRTLLDALQFYSNG